MPPKALSLFAVMRARNYILLHAYQNTVYMMLANMKAQTTTNQSMPQQNPSTPTNTKKYSLAGRRATWKRRADGSGLYRNAKLDIDLLLLSRPLLHPASA